MNVVSLPADFLNVFFELTLLLRIHYIVHVTHKIGVN